MGRWPCGCRRRTTQGIRWGIGLLVWFSTQPHAVIIGYSVLRRFKPLLILQGLMFMKITFRDRAVILQPIHPDLITKIYSVAWLSGPHLSWSFSLCECRCGGSITLFLQPSPGSSGCRKSAVNLCVFSVLAAWLVPPPPKALNHLAQWISLGWAKLPNCALWER